MSTTSHKEIKVTHAKTIAVPSTSSSFCAHCQSFQSTFCQKGFKINDKTKWGLGILSPKCTEITQTYSLMVRSDP
jgi:hypothetical protein